MKQINIKKVIEILVNEGKIKKADKENARILADNLPEKTILHFAGETPFLIDGEKVFFYSGDMEDFAYSDFDITLMEKTTRESLEAECLDSLYGYGWRNQMRKILPEINEQVFDK